jgi:hypothetical protein
MNKKLNFRRCAPLDWCEPEHQAGPFHWSESEHFLNILNILNVFRFYESVQAENFCARCSHFIADGPRPPPNGNIAAATRAFAQR